MAEGVEAAARPTVSLHDLGSTCSSALFDETLVDRLEAWY